MKSLSNLYNDYVSRICKTYISFHANLGNIYCSPKNMTEPHGRTFPSHDALRKCLNFSPNETPKM